MTNGFSDVRYTALFPFTLAGRKLGVVFIFHGKRGKRLHKESVSWQQELLPPPKPGQQQQKAYFFFNKAGFMDAQIYAEVIRCLHRELMDVRDEDPNCYPRTHLLHDRAPAHIMVYIEDVLESVNMGSTLVKLTAKFQIFDVGLGRVVRSGYLAEHVLHFHSHELKVGALIFLETKDAKTSKSSYEGPFRVLEFAPEQGKITLDTRAAANYASDAIIVERSRAKKNVIRRAAYRKLAVSFLCNVWYTYVKEDLIRKLALRTGTLAAWDGSQDSGVHVYAGQYQVPFGPVREKVLAREKKGSAGTPESLARAVNEVAYQQALERIEKAAEERRAAKRDKEKKKKKKKKLTRSRKRKRKHSQGSITEQERPKKRGRPRKGTSEAEVEEVVQASASSTSEDSSSEQDSDAYEGDEQWKEFLTDKQVARYQEDQNVDLDKTFMKGEMVVIAGHPECGDQLPFYVGAVVDEKSGAVPGRFTMHFYNNPKQDPYGTFKPAWLDTKFDPPKECYGQTQANSSDRYGPVQSWAEVTWVLARGFKLTRGKKLPDVLENSLQTLLAQH